MTVYDGGANVERKAKKELESSGYYVVRSAGSKGAFDLIAIPMKNHIELTPNVIRLIQCKKSSSEKGNYKKDRLAIDSLSFPINVRKEIWIWVKKEGWKKEIWE